MSSLIINCIAVSKEYIREKVGFVFEKVLDFRNFLWYVVVLTGGATYEKYDKRTMARKHNSARGQPNELKGDEGTPRIHGKASRGLGENLHRRAEGDLRKVPRSEARND